MSILSLSLKKRQIYMRIDEISAIKVCDISLNYNEGDRRTHSGLWDTKWVESKSNIFTQNNGRCYFIVVSGEIYKIGFSDQEGGIKKTIGSYKASGNSGQPSDRTHGVHILIAEELLKGNTVEFYFTYNEDIEVPLTLMDGTTKTITHSIGGKILESENIKLFLEKENRHPIWNLQEAGKPWPSYLQESRKKLIGDVKNGIAQQPATLKDIKSRLMLS